MTGTKSHPQQQEQQQQQEKQQQQQQQQQEKQHQRLSNGDSSSSRLSRIILSGRLCCLQTINYGNNKKPSLLGNTTTLQAAVWLVLWTVTNVAVTILNKYCFSTVINFPFPYMLTALHMLACTVFTQSCVYCGGMSAAHTLTPNNNKMWIVRLFGEPIVPPMRQQSQQQSHKKKLLLLWLFSIIYSLNIGVGNVSLRHVSVNFNQVMRSLVPVVTLWIVSLLAVLLGKQQNNNNKISMQKQRAVWPVVAGVAMAAYGDRLNFNAVGFLSTALCVILASVKVVVSSEFLTGDLKLHPLELLYYMAPAAFLQCLVLSVLSGEVASIAQTWNTKLSPAVDVKPCGVVFISSLLAVWLNIAALQAYKLTSPLTVCIASAVKQVLMVVLGTMLFRTAVSVLNGLGIVIVILGSLWYSYVSVAEAAALKTQRDKDDDDEEKALLEASSSTSKH